MTSYTPEKNTTKSSEPLDWIPNLSVVKMWLNRGGGYHGPEYKSSSIHEGGEWAQFEGVLVHDRGDLNHAVFLGFKGEYQSTCRDKDYCYFPDGPKEFIRAATQNDIDAVISANKYIVRHLFENK